MSTQGKPRFTLLPASIQAVMECARIGLEEKGYPEHGWQKDPQKYSQVMDGLMRHLIKYWYCGEDFDDDGFHHMAAVAYRAMWLIEYDATGNGEDDRPNT